MSQARSTLTLSEDDLRGDAIQPGHPLFGLIWINPERMSGAPCFTGSRVPVRALFDYIEAGESVDSFLEGFPPITREQAIAVLQVAEGLLEDYAAR